MEMRNMAAAAVATAAVMDTRAVRMIAGAQMLVARMIAGAMMAAMQIMAEIALYSAHSRTEMEPESLPKQPPRV
jgi:hypothetical protein